MVVTKRDQRLTTYQSFVCGSVAGFAAKTLTAPLDVVKIRTQVGTIESRYGMLNTVHRLYKTGGLKAFWKGNFIGCCRLIPFSVVQLLAFNRLKLICASSEPCGRLNVWTALAAGAGAGLIATAMLYPTDTIKTRLIVQPLEPHLVKYRGIIDVVGAMASREGLGSFYRGMSTTVLGVLPFTAATFAAYESLDVVYKRYDLPTNAISGFTNGCAAAIFAQAVSFPFDTIRKKMQAQSDILPLRGNVDVHFNGMVDAFKKTFNRYGILGFWRGCLVNTLRCAPYSGIMFATYESCKKTCLFTNGYTVSFLPHVDDPHPHIDQSLKPEELDDYFEEMHLSGYSWDDFDCDDDD